MKSAMRWTVLCAAVALLSQGCDAPDSRAAAPSQASKSAYTQSQHTFRAGKLIGTEAKDSQGKGLGDVKDFTLNPQTGEMFALIDIGGGHWATVPWQLIKVTTDSKGNLVVTVNTPKSVLQGAPSVTKDQWNSLQDPSYTQRVYSYFQIQPSAMGAPSGQSEKQQGQGQSGADQQKQTEQQQKDQQQKEEQKQMEQQQKTENQGGAAQGQETNQQNQPQP